MLPFGDLARSTLPAADAARVLVGAGGDRIITVLSLISLPPMLNAIMMIGTRILFAMGRDGLLWERAATVGAGGTPTVAMLVTTAVAVAGIITGTFQRLVALPRSFWSLELRDLLPGAHRAAAARAGASASVPRVGLPVVGRHRAGRRRRAGHWHARGRQASTAPGGWRCWRRGSPAARS